MTILGQKEEKTDTKNWTSSNSASELTNPLENGIKIIQAFESLNSDVQARSQAHFGPTRRGGHRREKLDCKEFNY